MDWRARVVLEFGLNAYKLGGGNDVVGGEVGHELVVEEGVEDFGAQRGCCGSILIVAW